MLNKSYIHSINSKSNLLYAPDRIVFSSRFVYKFCCINDVFIPFKAQWKRKQCEMPTNLCVYWLVNFVGIKDWMIWSICGICESQKCLLYIIWPTDLKIFILTFTSTRLDFFTEYFPQSILLLLLVYYSHRHHEQQHQHWRWFCYTRLFLFFFFNFVY